MCLPCFILLYVLNVIFSGAKTGCKGFTSAAMTLSTKNVLNQNYLYYCTSSLIGQNSVCEVNCTLRVHPFGKRSHLVSKCYQQGVMYYYIPHTINI